MRYALGSLQPDRSAFLVAFLSRLHVQLTQELLSREETLSPLGAVLERHEPQRHVDICSQLDSYDRDWSWLQQVAATVTEMATAARPLTLIDCEHTPGEAGSCMVLLHDPAVAAAIRVNDTVTAGVALLRAPNAELMVMPRLFRKVCSNGAVLDLGNGIEDDVAPWAVGDAVRACLGVDANERVFARLRAAAATAADPDDLLARATLATPSDDVAAEWRAGHDRSVFGAINAATGLAHAERDPRRRLELERDAERLLAAAESRAEEMACRRSLVSSRPRHAIVSLP